jgi:protein-tyrosine phosphatase
MIDIHNHILPAVDDGAKNIEMAIEMAQIASADGVKAIVVTPHFNSMWSVHRDLVLENTNELQKTFDNLGISIRLFPGNEIRLENKSFVEKALHLQQACTLADSGKFILLEQSWESYYLDTPKVIQSLREKGITPIIPHPERHYFFREQPELLDECLALGAWTQVTVDSLLGQNGPDAQSFAYQLVDRGLVHTIATDAHHLSRKPNLSQGFDIIEKKAGWDAVNQIHRRLEQIIEQ